MTYDSRPAFGNFIAIPLSGWVCSFAIEMCQTGVWLWMINWKDGQEVFMVDMKVLMEGTVPWKDWGKNLHNNSVKIAGFQAENKYGFSWICSRIADRLIIMFSEDNTAYSVHVVRLHMNGMFTLCFSAYLFSVWTKC